MSELRKPTFVLDKEASSEINKIFTVTIPKEIFKAWADKQQQPGFRPGKVPLRLLKKEDFLKSILSNVLDEIKIEEKIDIVFASNYVINKFEYETDIEITISVEKVPNIEAINCEAMEVQKFKGLITEENIQMGIKNYATYHAKAGEASEKLAQKGDFVTLKIEIIDKNENKKETHEQEIRLGYNTMIPAVESALENQKTGYVHNHQVNPAVEIELEIKEIKEPKLLSNEEIAKNLGIEENKLNEEFKKRLTEEAEKFSENLILETIKKAIVDKPFEVPLSLVQREFKKAWDQTLSNLNYVKELNLEEFVQSKLGISTQQLQKDITNLAAAQAKIRFMYYSIAKEQSIKIQESEINEALNSQIRFFNNNLEEARKFYEKNEEAKEEMLENILFIKIAETLVKQVQKTKAKEVSLEDLYKINVEQLEYKMLDNKVLEINENDNSIQKNKNRKTKSNEPICG